MAARNSWATQASGPTGLITVEDARLAIAALMTKGTGFTNMKSGFRPRSIGNPDDPGVVYASGTPDAFVHVASFQAFLQSTRSAAAGAYIMTLDVDFDVNILSTPANATNPRDDLIIAQQSDTFYGDGVSTWTIRQVVGTPAGSPSDPAVTGSPDYIPLARVRVPANATTITSGNITDLRASGHAKSLVGGLTAVAIGGILPVRSQAERDALGKYVGLAVWRSDTTPQRIEVTDGTNWLPLPPYGMLPVANLAARNAIAGLYEGLAVWRQDIDAVNVYDGSGWRYFARPQAATVATVQTTTSTSFTDLATSGPAVTIETGTAAEVTLYTQCSVDTATQFVVMGFAVSGASTVAAADNRSIGKSDTGNVLKAGATFLVEGLTPGSNTFTCKYRVTGGTGSYNDRRITAKAV